VGLKCKFTKPDGKQCGAYALKDGEGYCLFHDPRPEIQKIRNEAAEAAGRSQKIYFPEVIENKPLPLTKAITIKKPTDVKKAIGRTLQEVRNGQICIEVARTILYGLNVYVNALKMLDSLHLKNPNEASNLTKEEQDELTHLRQQL